MTERLCAERNQACATAIRVSSSASPSETSARLLPRAVIAHGGSLITLPRSEDRFRARSVRHPRRRPSSTTTVIIVHAGRRRLSIPWGPKVERAYAIPARRHRVPGDTRSCVTNTSTSTSRVLSIHPHLSPRSPARSRAPPQNRTPSICRERAT